MHRWKLSIISKIILLTVTATFAQEPQFDWALQAGGAQDDVGMSTQCDHNGNTYLTGRFQDSASFGDTVLVTDFLHKMFLVKYDNYGTLQWARQATGQGISIGTALAVDNENNCLLAGFFGGELILEDTSFTSQTFDAPFLAKFSPAGDLLWAIHFQTMYGNIYDLAVGSGGTIYVTGRFDSTLMIEDSLRISQGGSDLFVAKFSPQGELLNLRTIGTSGIDWGNAIVPDSAGNLYLYGKVENFYHFMNGNVDTTLKGGFITKFSPQGEMTWLVGIQNYAAHLGIKSMELSPEQGIVIGGNFANFVTIHDTTLTTGDDIDIFIAKLSGDGQVLWVDRNGGIYNDEVQNLSVDKNGIITLCGSSNYLNLYYYGYALRYDNDGNFLWSRLFGGPYNTSGSGVSNDADNNIYLTGTFNLMGVFGDTLLTSAGRADVFLLKLTPGVPLTIEEPLPIRSDLFALLSNYPNPFNPSTTIPYLLNLTAEVELSIYNILGQKVITLVKKEQPPGQYQITWEGVDQNGNAVASGVYLYQLKVKTPSKQEIKSKKMMLLR